MAAVDEIDTSRPHPFRLVGEDWVLADLRTSPDQTAADTDSPKWTAVPAACPHRLAPLSAGHVEAGRIICGYHGWCFDQAGRCVEIPALGVGATVPPTAHLRTAWGVEQRYGLIWVALDEPVTPIPDLPEWTDPRLGHAPMPRQEWRAGAGQMTDNFLDVAHFPFTHLGTIGNPDEIEVGSIEVVRGDAAAGEWFFDATYAHTARSIEESAEQGAEAAAVVERVMRFRCWAPHHLKLLIDYGPDGDLLLLFFHQPVDAETTGLYCLILAENIADGRMTAEEQVEFQFRVGAEDRAMLEQLTAKGLPLDPGVETHTRADRSTVELRRLLADVAALAGEA